MVQQIIHRLKDSDDKLVVVPAGKENMTDEELEVSTDFQEKRFAHAIVRES